jgi:hypothetical protein
LIKLFNLSGSSLSKGIKNISPILYEGIRIENQLLDGTTHIQTIGDAKKYFNFEILADQEQVDNTNYTNSQGGKLKLVVDDNYYIGFAYVSEWKRITIRHITKSNRWYTSTVKFVINEEGIL